MTGIDKDIFRAIRSLTTLLNEACNHWNYLCPYLAELGGAADRALEGYARDYPEDVKALIAERPAPLRNCDVGTTKEQTERMLNEYCLKHECLVFEHGVEQLRCPLYEDGNDCRLKWAQMPYTEKGAGK